MNIRLLREKKGWTQERLAYELGVSVATVTRWERDETGPSRMAQRRIMEVLEVSEGSINQMILDRLERKTKKKAKKAL